MRISVAALLCALAVALCGCVFSPEEGTASSGSSTAGSSSFRPASSSAWQAADTPGVELLQRIWDAVPRAERFAVYGGSMDDAYMDAPGPLALTAEGVMSDFLFPEDYLQAVTEAASLRHLMNSNLFTAVTVQVAAPAQVYGLFVAWREQVQHNQWIWGQPERLAFAQFGEDRLVMLLGSVEAAQLAVDAMLQAYPQAQVLYSEAVVS